MARRQRRVQGKQKAKAKGAPKPKGPKRTEPKNRPTPGRHAGRGGGSWMQPGRLAACAALLGLLGAAFVIAAGYVAVDARGMRDAPVCQGAARPDAADCLRQISGRLNGSYPKYRGPGTSWHFKSTERGVDSTTVRGTGDRTLTAWRDQEVTGLFWHGRLVAFENPATGERVESEEFGTTGAALRLTVGLLALAAAIVLARDARAGSLAPPPPVAKFIGVSAGAAFAVLLFGGSVALSFWSAVAAVAVVAGWRGYRRWRQTARSSASMIR